MKNESGLTRPDSLPISPPQIWGVLNVTPDSFSDGGAFLDHPAAFAHADRMVADGADVIDVGGESSRPPGQTYGAGAQAVSAFEELRRVLPVVERLRGRGVRVSVDTVKPEVAREVIRAGAQVINDVSCGRSPELLETVAKAGAELVLMHNRGRGERSGANVIYGDVVRDVREELMAAVTRALDAGVEREHIWLDPGLGFAKTARQSLALLGRIDVLIDTGHRVLVGASRKSFIAESAPLFGGAVPSTDARLSGGAAAAAIAAFAGCHALRVHDVSEIRQAAWVARAAREASC